MNDLLLSLAALILTSLLAFWLGYAKATARGVRYGYAAGLRHARNMLRNRGM